MDNLPFLILYDKEGKPQQILQPCDGNCPYYMLWMWSHTKMYSKALHALWIWGLVGM